MLTPGVDVKTPAEADSTRQRRPRDRKAQIVTAAADLFHQRGFHAVTMEEISGAVGITAGALYKHFRNKQELLAHAALDGLLAFESVVETTPAGDVTALLHTTAGLALERRYLAALWQRESRSLSDVERAQLRRRFRVIAARTVTVLQGARPDLPADDADLQVWAAFAVFASPSYHSIKLPPARWEDLLYAMGGAVLNAILPPTDSTIDSDNRTPHATGDAAGLTRASRREVLMDVAARLFDQRGYQAVSMEDIGAAAGISGASIYNHVTAKSELLVAALSRAAEALNLDASRAFATATSPRHALDLLLRSYIDLTLAHSHLTGALISEVRHLPDEPRHTIRRLQLDYINEWVHLLAAERPDLTDSEARAVVHAVLGIVNDIARIEHLRHRPNLAGDLTMLGRVALLGPAPRLR